MEPIAKAVFLFGYKYTAAEIDELKEKVFPEDPMRKNQFFADYLIGPTSKNEYFIGVEFAETDQDRHIEAEELKLQPSQLRELKYIMMNIRITEPPKFYMAVIY